MAGDLGTTDVDQLCASWLELFAAALTASDGRSAKDLFHPDGWWRDLLAFSWDLRTAHGEQAIAALLVERSETSAVSMRLVGEADVVETDSGSWVQALFEFESSVVRGRGVLRLVERDGTWRAWTVMTATDELVGHEELTGTRRPSGGAQGTDRKSRSWQEGRRRQREFTDGEPQVLVVGGGHGGLGLAARLGCLGVDTLVVDRNERIGDNWRHRYDSLVLHDPVWYDHLPYLPFPANWPVYSPKDKLADWLEHYASVMELNVWAGTELVESSYDGDRHEWTVTIRRADGRQRTLRPRHLVLATGISGTEPNVPVIPGAEDFRGLVCHSKEFPHGSDFAGKKAIVVGACNSGHDLAQELHESGADVTMVQRSPTYVVSVEASGLAMAGLYDETGPPTEVADLIGASFPFLAVPDMHRATTAAMADADKELLAGLERAGFQLSPGIDGTGALMLFLQRGGGYYINVGASELISDGQIKIESGVDVRRFTPSGLELSNGDLLDADVVVLATGYQGIVQTARRILGDDVADQCGPVWGLDAEGELQGVWRHSGHEGLWFMGGNLAMARFYGKFLALQIKAVEAGVLAGRSGHSTAKGTSV